MGTCHPSKLDRAIRRLQPIFRDHLDGMTISGWPDQVGRDVLMVTASVRDLYKATCTAIETKRPFEGYGNPAAARLIGLIDGILERTPAPSSWHLPVTFTAGEVAKRLGKNVVTITRLCKQGKFPGAFPDNGEWRIPESALPEKRPKREAMQTWECLVGCGKEVVAVQKPVRCPNPNCGGIMSLKRTKKPPK